MVEEVVKTALDAERMGRLKEAFEKAFVGDADKRLTQYLMRCCKSYYEHPSFHVAPYMVVTQSSGFGKSRVLFEMAKRLAGPNEELLRDSALDAQLMYVCAPKPGHVAKTDHYATRFPIATPELSDFFFAQEDVTKRLLVAVDYACAHWQTAKTGWLELFLFGAAPLALAHDNKRANPDEALASALQEMLARATKMDPVQEPLPKKSRAGSKPAQQDQCMKVLVLAIDDASHLLRSNDYVAANFCDLGRALNRVNKHLRKKKRNAMVFAVLVDSNPQITKSQIRARRPPLIVDPPCLMGRTGAPTKFPPFVLTHTMDVMLNRHLSQVDPAFDYKASVLEDDPHKVWDTLVSMGRPLWHSHVPDDKTIAPMYDVLYLAESKLLGGLSPVKKQSYADKTRRGVASMLCRLGLRPQSNSAFASQVIADLMGVLHYANNDIGANICGYETEPVLAFAATHLWYEIDPLPLEKFILPQFRDLLMHGDLDVIDIGEVVARIFFLLAMDTATNPDLFGLYGKIRFMGQFCSVKRFLGLLDGSCKPHVSKTDPACTESGEPKLFNVTTTGEAATTSDDASPDQKTSFQSWMNDWEGWSVGFSHFIELSAMPTEATLWFLLGRRAAGVFPREQEKADLIIPTFSKSAGEVSFILVQVSNNNSASSDLPLSVFRDLVPASVFELDEASNTKNELSAFLPRKIIRIYLSLREYNTIEPAQSYIIDNSEATRVNDKSYLLCLHGVCRTGMCKEGSRSSLAHWPFLLSEKVSDQLVDLADSAE